MLCDIVIPLFNQKKYTQDCIESIKENTHVSYRIIIVDDKSDDLETKKYLDKIKNHNIKVIQNEQNLGWVKSVNRGLFESSAEYVCVINNDTIVTENWLSEMISIASAEPDIGLVNPEWEKPERIPVQDYAQKLRRFKGEFIETDWTRGFCFLIKRRVLDKIGGLDEAYSPGYFDDWDFSVRAIKSGFRCVKTKAAFVYHYRNITHKHAFDQEFWNDLMERNKRLFYERWGKPLRIVFIFNQKIANKEQIEQLLFLLAREQHRLYIWITNKNMPQIEHANVRITKVMRFLFSLFTIMNIFDNLGRNINKRYDAIFINDMKLFNLFLAFGFGKKIKIFLNNFDSLAIQNKIKTQLDKINN